MPEAFHQRNLEWLTWWMAITKMLIQNVIFQHEVFIDPQEMTIQSAFKMEQSCSTFWEFYTHRLSQQVSLVEMMKVQACVVTMNLITHPERTILYSHSIIWRNNSVLRWVNRCVATFIDPISLIFHFHWHIFTIGFSNNVHRSRSSRFTGIDSEVSRFSTNRSSRF